MLLKSFASFTPPESGPLASEYRRALGRPSRYPPAGGGRPITRQADFDFIFSGVAFNK